MPAAKPSVLVTRPFTVKVSVKPVSMNDEEEAVYAWFAPRVETYLISLTLVALQPVGLAVSEGAAKVTVGKVPSATSVIDAAVPPDCSEPRIVPLPEVVMTPPVDRANVQLLVRAALSVTFVALAGCASKIDDAATSALMIRMVEYPDIAGLGSEPPIQPERSTHPWA